MVAMLQTMRGDIGRRDEGFSVLEVVLASFVLFFVLTAVLGLVGTSTRMSLDAKGRAAMTNAVASHVEWVRSLDFDQIAMSGSSAEAMLQPTYTYTVDRFTVTIENTISSGQDGTKEIQITATAVADGYPTVTMTTFTAIRNRDNEENYETDEGPIITIDSPTPEADTVVYSSYQLGGSPLYVAASAEAQGDGVTISKLTFYASSEPLRDGSTIFAGVAHWTPDTQSVSETFRWDTRQVNDEGESVIEDGYRTVSIVAIDSESRQSTMERRFYVDNYAPDVPGEPFGEVQDSTETRVSWSQAYDGTDPALKYELQILEIMMDGSPDLYGSFITDDPAYIQTTSLFARYIPVVRAGTPRNLWSDWVDGEAYTSRPEIMGDSNTWFEGRNSRRESFTDVNIHCSTPSFGTSDVTYDLYRSMDPDNISSGAAYETDIGSSFYEQINKKVGKFGEPDPYYYQYKVTFTSTGPMGGTEEEIWSNVIGPISMDGSATMEHYTW